MTTAEEHTPTAGRLPADVLHQPDVLRHILLLHTPQLEPAKTFAASHYNAAVKRLDELRRCALVNRTWREIVQAEIDSTLCVDSETIERVLRRMQEDKKRADRVKRLYIAGNIETEGDEHLWPLISCCTRLELLATYDLPNPTEDERLPATLTAFLIDRPLFDPIGRFIHDGIALQHLYMGAIAEPMDGGDNEYASLMQSQRDWSALRTLGWSLATKRPDALQHLLASAENLRELGLVCGSVSLRWISWPATTSLTSLWLQQVSTSHDWSDFEHYQAWPESIRHLKIDISGVEVEKGDEAGYVNSLQRALEDRRFMPSLETLDIPSPICLSSLNWLALTERFTRVNIDFTGLQAICDLRGIALASYPTVTETTWREKLGLDGPSWTQSL